MPSDSSFDAFDAWQSGATPVVLLTKVDIATDVAERVAAAQTDVVGADVFVVSAATGEGLGALVGYLASGQTIAMVGPSGAGKSTLTNALGAGTFALQTGAVRDDGKGWHTTTARELVVLPSGAVAIDTPGLRGLATPHGSTTTRSCCVNSDGSRPAAMAAPAR